MATVRKREWQNKKGQTTKWVVDYVDQQGARHAQMFDTRREAINRLDEIKTEVKAGTHTPIRASITVAEAGELWISQAETDGLEESTIRQYRQHLKRHIEPILANVKLAQLATTTIPGFRNKLIEKGCSQAMARKVVISLGAILANAMAHGKVARNVVHEQPKARRRRQRQMEKRHENAIKAGVDFPLEGEMQAMLVKAQIKADAAKEAGRTYPFHPLLVTAVFTGMRASELRGLTWDAVDLKNETVYVRQRANLWGTIGPTKSEAGRREIPLPPGVVKVLKEWKLACPKGELSLVFPNGAGNVENHANIVNRGFDPLQMQANIVDRHKKPKYGFHSLRHFYASQVIRRYSSKRAQTLLGHGSITMTFDVYGHLFPEAENDREKAASIETAVLGC